MFIFYLALAAAWLNPFATGPSTSVLPWIVTLCCVALAEMAEPQQRGAGISRKVLIFFALSALLFTTHALRVSARAEVLATLVAWACVALMAHVGAKLGSDLGSSSVGWFSARRLAWLLLVVALASVVMAVCQYVGVEHWFAPWISASGDGQAFANLRQRNQFATLCGIGLFALLYGVQTGLPNGTSPVALRKDAMAGRGGHAAPAVHAETGATSYFNGHWLVHTIGPWLAVTVLAIGNGLSSSRTGALQWLLIAVAVLCWRASLHRKVVQLGLGAVAIYALVVALMPWFASAVGNSSIGLLGRAQENAGSSSRLWLYSNVLELIAQKPWLGWGWRELAYAHYSTPFDRRFGELLDNAHNLPLHLAVELGVPFALLLCGAVLWCIVRAAPWRETDAARQLAWGVLMLMGVHSMVEYPLWYGPFLMTLGLCIGLLQPVDLMREKLASSNSVPNRPLAQLNKGVLAIKIVAICLLAFAGYAAYDYHRVSQIYLDVESRSSLYSGDALGHAQRSVLFQRQARFAELVTTPVTPASAPRVLSLAADLIHFSPEPRVIEALIESATMLHMDDVAVFHLGRYKEVYPKDYAAWSALK
jgi:Virulence factor membrane-bound polymerase, C-terminal/O-Antigen ligase/Protein glycosylation ligase